MTHIKTVTTIAAIALTGCASSHVQVQINTQPPGAYVTGIQGTAVGMAPTVLHYEKAALKQHRDAAGCSLIQGFTAQWPSGATASTEPTLRLCGGLDGYSTTIARPNVPGLAQDLDHAVKLTTSGAAQRQAGATEDAAAFQFMNLMKSGR